MFFLGKNFYTGKSVKFTELGTNELNKQMPHNLLFSGVIRAA